MLFQEDVTLTIGSKTIIKNSHICIDKNVKYCIIGPNGVGKTTLMNYIYEKIKSNVDVLYITQTDIIIDNCNVYDYMLMADKKLYEMFIKHAELEKISDFTDDTLKKYNDLSIDLKTLCFDKYKANIKKILNGLGFCDSDNNLQINSLSGGQHAKLSLCKALLLEPELLLLDEPTNHLDLNNTIWLENYLLTYKKGLIMISHNIDFFDNICQKFMFFFNCDPLNPSIHTCKGGYDKFKKLFKLKKDEYMKEYKKYCDKINELNKNTNKDPLKKYMRSNQINKPIRDCDASIKFNNVGLILSNRYTNIISFNDVCFSYDDKSVLENVNIGISMSSRYILVGDNGSGKSTFFKLCSQELLPNIGEIQRDSKVIIGYFNQNSITELPLDLTPIQYLQTIDHTLDQQKCRIILSHIGFKKMYDGDIFNVEKLIISDLSGGQKVKLVLCGIQIKNPHIILFDEPTNHLDMYSLEELISAINEYNGGIVIITHDKYIIENINDYKLIIMRDKKMFEYNGNFKEYCDQLI